MLVDVMCADLTGVKSKEVALSKTHGSKGDVDASGKAQSLGRSSRYHTLQNMLTLPGELRKDEQRSFYI